MPTSLVGALVGAVVTQALGYTVLAYVAGALASTIINSALSSKPKQQQQQGYSQQLSGRTITVRQPIASRQVIYGQVRTGGVITYMEMSENNAALHIVITLAGHPCEEIGDVYFDDELVPFDVDGVATGRWIQNVLIEKSLGDEAGQPFPELVAASAGLWTDAHRQTGCAKIHLTLYWVQVLFPNGIPNISVVMKGKRVFDPRLGSPSTEVYSANSALCVADYLTYENGLAADYTSEIDDALLIAAANICDELVQLNRGSPDQFETRYETNGTFLLSEVPRDLLPELLGAMQGRLVHIGGVWRIRAGAYLSPAVTLDEGDARGKLAVTTRLSARDSFNGVKGVFVDPNSNWQPTDFPPVTNATYLAQDNGERVWQDVNLRFTTSASMAQRLAKIELERVRQEITVAYPCHLAQYVNQPPETLAVNNTAFGWSAKPFEIMELGLVPDVDEAGEPVIGVDFSLRETASTVYDWSYGEETVMDPAPDTNLPDPLSVTSVAGLLLTSGTAELFIANDGTVHSRIRVRWTAVIDAFVTSGGRLEMQYALAAGSPQTWLDAPDIDGGSAETYIAPVEDGVAYDVRVRAVNSYGVESDWAYVYGHVVAGKSAAPSDVTGFAAAQQGPTVLFSCAQVDDVDLDLIEIRLGDAGNDNWDDGSPLTNILRGRTSTSSGVPPGSWMMLAKAKDTSGNYSTNAATVSLTVTADGYVTITSAESASRWSGQLTNMVRHWTGVLVPDSQSLASALGWELFDEFVPDAYADCYFTASIIDKGMDGSARIYADIVSVLGPGETTGVASPDYEIDTRLAAGGFDGFTAWTIGADNFRYLQGRIHVDTTLGKPVISGFNQFIDSASRSESGTLTVDGTGSGAQLFTTQFNSAPVVQLTPAGSGDVSASYTLLTTSGFTGHFKTGGVAGAGSMSWTATGA